MGFIRELKQLTPMRKVSENVQSGRLFRIARVLSEILAPPTFRRLFGQAWCKRVMRVHVVGSLFRMRLLDCRPVTDRTKIRALEAGRVFEKVQDSFRVRPILS